jgi:hypothetical protein
MWKGGWKMPQRMRLAWRSTHTGRSILTLSGLSRATKLRYEIAHLAF